MSVGRFLGGIMALVREVENGRYLLLQRASSKDVGAGTWECVTGRVDQGESFEEALYREVQEEIGVTPQIEFILGTTHFFAARPFPKTNCWASPTPAPFPPPAASTWATSMMPTTGSPPPS